MLLRTTIFVLACLTSPLLARVAAQSTWVVDINRGSGYTHVDLRAALASAAHGDFIEVRAGTYSSPGTIQKAVRIVGQPGATIDIGSIGSPFAIQGVPSGQVCVLKGFTIKGLYTSSGFAYLRDNPGSIVLQDLKTSSALILTAGMSMLRCRAVHLDRCQILGGLHIESSTVTVTAGRFDNNRAAAAILAKNASVTLSGVQATGLAFSGPGMPALEARGSTLLLSKGNGSTLSASSGSTGLPAIRGDASSTLVYDPAVQLNPNPSTKAIQGFGSVSSRRLPSLDARGGALGKSLSLDIRSAQGDFYALFVGAPGQPLVLPFGELWLDLRVLILVTAGFQGATELNTTTLPIPSTQSLRGLTLCWQVQSGPWPQLEYSNAFLSLLR